MEDNCTRIMYIMSYDHVLYPQCMIFPTSLKLPLGTSLCILWTLREFFEITLLMPQKHPRFLPSHQMSHVLQTPEPGIVVPHERPLRTSLLPVLPDVEQIRSQHDGASVDHVQLKGDAARRMTRGMVQGDTRPNIKGLPSERLPVEAVRLEVVRHVKVPVDACRTAPEGMFQLILVAPNLDIYTVSLRPRPKSNLMMNSPVSIKCSNPPA